MPGLDILDFLGPLGGTGKCYYTQRLLPTTLNALTYRHDCVLCMSRHARGTCASLTPTRQGLLDVGKVKAGETLVVSGAAGATGSIVCQIGKKKGAKVFAIAGSKEKCDWLEKDVGVDKALNYKSPTFHDDFKKAVGYVDVYFDNVGGDMLNFVLTRLNVKARIVLCGTFLFVSSWGWTGLTSLRRCHLRLQ